MSLVERKQKLDQRMRKERKRVNDKYRKLKARVEAECENHEFGEWHTEYNARTGFPVSNFLKETFYFKKCARCGKKISKVFRECRSY